MAAMILPDKELIGKLSRLKLSHTRATNDCPSVTLSSGLLAKLSKAASLLFAYVTVLILLEKERESA